MFSDRSIAAAVPVVLAAALVVACGSKKTNPPDRELAATLYTFPDLANPTPGFDPGFGTPVIADLNGDGRKDIAIVSIPTDSSDDYTLVVMYQGSSGAFDRNVEIPVADLGMRQIFDVAAGDFNGDGRTDLALLCIPPDPMIGVANPVVILLYQDSTGDLQDPVSFPLPPLEVGAGRLFAVGDLNSDGKDDVLITGVPLRVMFQQPGGGLGPVSDLKVSSAGAVLIGDMDHDGDNDIVFRASSTSFGVLKQIAPGTFADTPETYTLTINNAGFGLGSLTVADVNGDGRLDVVADEDSNSGYINIFIQNAGGHLDPPLLVKNTFDDFAAIAIADFDRDGLPDMFLNSGIDLQLMYQNPDRSFQDPLTLSLPNASPFGPYHSMAVGDINGDGWPDIVLGDSDLSVMVLVNVPQ